MIRKILIEENREIADIVRHLLITYGYENEKDDCQNGYGVVMYSINKTFRFIESSSAFNCLTYEDSIVEDLIDILCTDISTNNNLYDEEDVRDIADLSYIIGVYNVVGIDGLNKELERLKTLNITPYDIIKNAQKYGNKDSV